MATAPEILEDETKRNIKGVQVALVALVGVVLLGAGWFFFLKGDPAVEAVPEAPVIEPVPSPPVDEGPAEDPGTQPNAPGEGPKETTEVFAPKDPFEPLVSAVGATTTDTSGATDTTATTDDPADPAVDETPVEDNGAGGPGGGGGGGNTQGVGGREVQLNDVSTEPGAKSASVKVDGVIYDVMPGDRFAENFKLVTVYGKCATMLYGDDQFTLCEGEHVLK